jgi:hypothetical protein
LFVSLEISVHQKIAVKTVIIEIDKINFISMELNHHTRFIIINKAAIDAINGQGLFSIMWDE